MGEVFVGIDVSKEYLDVASRPGVLSERFENNAGGIAKLTERLRQLAPKLVVLEATGGYEASVAAEIALSAQLAFGQPGLGLAGDAAVLSAYSDSLHNTNLAHRDCAAATCSGTGSRAGTRATRRRGASR